MSDNNTLETENNEICGNLPFAELSDEVDIATETHKGKVRLATEAEAIEGVVENAAVTPATLRAATYYVHNQGVASGVWEINHNLNRCPQITAVDSAGNKFIPAIKYVDENNVILYMKGSMKGKAYLS